MSRVDSEFKNKVYEVVAQIPKGRVATYGQVAALAGAAWAAWEVGQIAHTGPADLPWQRVVNKSGGLARGYPGGMEGHRQALQKDDIEASQEYKVNIAELLWQPIAPNQSSLL